jgi:hypothetical protein
VVGAVGEFSVEHPVPTSSAHPRMTVAPMCQVSIVFMAILLQER